MAKDTEKSMISFQWNQEAIDLLNEFVEIDEDNSRSDFIREAVWQHLLRQLREAHSTLDRLAGEKAIEAQEESGIPAHARDIQGWTIDPDDPEAVRAERTYRWALAMLHYLEQEKADHAKAVQEIEQLLKQIQTEAAA